MENRIPILLFLCLSILPINCTSTVSLDLSVLFYGKIIDEKNIGIDSAKIEVLNIEAKGHSSINTFIGRVYYSNKNGEYRLDLPGGVEWEENSISGKKEYIKYIENVTIKISKPTFKDTIVIGTNTDYEKSEIEKNVTLKKNK